jgi:deazaflavin-dependent oxidoreductase (nitroreductase family)
MKELTMSPVVERKLRQAFKYLNQFMVIMWRLGLGVFLRWRWLSGQIMVITHVGRKSGFRRRTPVNYALYDGDIYCTAGFGRISDWYRNIQQQPEIEVWLPDGWWQAVAEDVSDAEDAPERLHQVMIASGFAAYLFGVNPELLTKEDLAQLLHTYRVVRIRRTAACTGAGGPGDLAWVWPLATMVLAIWMPRRGRSKG